MAYQYWGRTTANGARGFLSIPQAMTQWNWYPCVRFTVNGGETEWIATGGSREGAWRVGQRVQVLYDPARPGEYALDGDAAPMHAVRADFIWAVVLTAAGAALLALYFI